jgi:hypothetical protein
MSQHSHSARRPATAGAGPSASGATFACWVEGRCHHVAVGAGANSVRWLAQAALQLDELIAVLGLKHVQHRVAACRLRRQQRLGSRRLEACGHLLVSGEVRLGLQAQVIEEGA